MHLSLKKGFKKQQKGTEERLHMHSICNRLTTKLICSHTGNKDIILSTEQLTGHVEERSEYMVHFYNCFWDDFRICTSRFLRLLKD